MFERLTARGAALGAEAAQQIGDNLLSAPLPSDVHAEPVGGGVRLSGRRLRRRWVDDTRLRNFGR